MLNFKEMIETAMRNQSAILREDQRKGAPLCYRAKDGSFIIRYPDGFVEKHRSICMPRVRASHA